MNDVEQDSQVCQLFTTLQKYPFLFLSTGNIIEVQNGKKYLKHVT